MILGMNSVLISEFKAKAIATLKRVRDTGEPLQVTIRGRAVAEIFPPRQTQEEGVVLGGCADLMVQRPADARLVLNDFADEWEMNR
jgi:antitoxin (DNA-binding transcriptional repressor) of toxin-antitoxin stability system